MIEKDIRQLFEEIDTEGKIPQGKMEELIAAMKDMEENPREEYITLGDKTVRALEEQLAAEPNWRKRAGLAAKIISANLD